tara:strand:+ start:465 stop:797 length:333 start_codon:yes stop_codon:yes gene_type:complete
MSVQTETKENNILKSSRNESNTAKHLKPSRKLKIPAYISKRILPKGQTHKSDKTYKRPDSPDPRRKETVRIEALGYANGDLRKIWTELPCSPRSGIGTFRRHSSFVPMEE